MLLRGKAGWWSHILQAHHPPPALVPWVRPEFEKPCGSLRKAESHSSHWWIPKSALSPDTAHHTQQAARWAARQGLGPGRPLIVPAGQLSPCIGEPRPLLFSEPDSLHNLEKKSCMNFSKRMWKKKKLLSLYRVPISDQV